MFLDFVPVNTNKTDFNRDSREWLAIHDEMHDRLNPHIEELLKRATEEPTEEDIQSIKRGEELYDIILGLIGHDNNDYLAGVVSFSGEDYGQKRPESRNDTVIISAKTERVTFRQKYHPRTPPPLDKIGVRRRLGRSMKWEARPMEETIRSKVEERDGQKILIVNTMFPGYQKSRDRDLYMLETVALQTVPLEDAMLTPQKYLEEFDNFFGKICENYEVAKEIMAKKKVKSIT